MLPVFATESPVDSIAVPVDFVTLLPTARIDEWAVRLELRIGALDEHRRQSDIPSLPIELTFRERPESGKYIPYSTRLQSFVTEPRHPNVLEPGKRPRVTLSPSLILKDGKPWLTISTPGGDNQDQAMLQAILDYLG